MQPTHESIARALAVASAKRDMSAARAKSTLSIADARKARAYRKASCRLGALLERMVLGGALLGALLGTACTPSARASAGGGARVATPEEVTFELHGGHHMPSGFEPPAQSYDHILWSESEIVCEGSRP